MGVGLYVGAILEAGVNVTAQAPPPFFIVFLSSFLCLVFIVRLLFRVYRASVVSRLLCVCCSFVAPPRV